MLSQGVSNQIISKCNFSTQDAHKRKLTEETKKNAHNDFPPFRRPAAFPALPSIFKIQEGRRKERKEKLRIGYAASIYLHTFQ